MATKHSSLILNMQDNLTLNDKPAGSRMRPPPPVRSQTGDKLENVPLRASNGHRMSLSQEEAMRARKAGASSGSSSGKPKPGKEELDIFADPSDSPQKKERRPVRRNSDSSIVSGTKVQDPEEEKKKQERRRRERERRHREREASKRKLDVIDKLDVTSIYGTGCKCFQPLMQLLVLIGD